MQDNAPSHSAKPTIAHLAKKSFNNKLIKWLPMSPEFNPIENLSIIKRNIYKNGNQFSSKEHFKKAIKIAVNNVNVKTIEK